jgi:hypothetical protein
VNTKAQQGSVHRFLAQWICREMATFAFKVAAVASLLLTMGTQDDLLSLNFSFRLFVKILLTVLVLYIVASFSCAGLYEECGACSSGKEVRSASVGMIHAKLFFS